MVVLNLRSVGFESDNRSTGARLGVYVGSLWAARSDDPDARRVPSRYGRLRPATVRAEHRSKHRSRPQQGLERLEKSRVYASHRAWARRPSGRAANAANNGPAAGVAVGSCRDTLAQTGADVRTLNENLTRLIINHLRWHHLSPQGRHVCRNACRIRGSTSAHARAPAAHDTAGSSVSYLVKDAIRRHQTPSDVIRRNQTQSDAIG